MRGTFKRKSQLHRVVIITIPLGGSVIAAGILTIGIIAAAVVFPTNTILENSISMAVGLTALLTVIAARRQVNNLRWDAVDAFHEITTLDTEDPEGAESESADLIRLPTRRDSANS
jgi:hypothetical protein